MQPESTAAEASQSNSTEKESTQPTASVLPQKRRGQFMDMVHPSSDMRNSSTTPKPLGRRPATVVAPLNPALVETSNNSDQPVSRATTENEHVDGHTGFDQAWPDPLDVMLDTSAPAGDTSQSSGIIKAEGSFSGAVSVEGKHDIHESDLSDIPVDAVVPENDDAAEAAGSLASLTPFIEGAAVEKRPLGSFTKKPEFTPTVEEPILDDLQEETVPFEAEKTEQTEHIDSEIDTQGLPQVASPESDTDTQPTAEEVVPEIEHETETVAPAEPTTAQSILQQYRSEEPTVTIEEHGVFDTTQYHQPLALPSKASKKAHTAILYLFVTVLMLAIGAAVGYAIFVLKLF